MQSILVYGIVIAAVSVITQWLKQYTFGSWRSQLILIGASLLGGLVYIYFQMHQDYWLEVVKIIAGANMVYTFLLQYLESPTAGAHSFFHKFGAAAKV